MPSTHWYARYVGDYKKDTAHLSMMQHGAFTLLMDYYYSTGRIKAYIDANAPTLALANAKHLYRICNAIDPEERQAVDEILSEFFYIEEGFYKNKRIERELSKRLDISEKRRYAQIKSMKSRKKPPRKTSSASAGASAGASAHTTTTTVLKEDRRLSSKKNDFENFWYQFPRQRRGNKQKAQTAYKNALTRDIEENIISGLQSYIASEEVKSGFAKGAAAWLNDDRWTTDYITTKGKTNGKLTNAEKSDIAVAEALAELSEPSYSPDGPDLLQGAKQIRQ